MKIHHKDDIAGGLTLIELLVVLGVLFILVLLLIPRSNGNRTSAPRINCVNNLRQVGLAFRDWALERSDMFPMLTPKLLICPADKRRRPATNFHTGFGNATLSYFVGVDATVTNFQMFLAGDRNLTNGFAKGGFLELATNAPASWTDELHKTQGNVCLADGSVQQFSRARLREAILWSGVTNRLAMP